MKKHTIIMARIILLFMLAMVTTFIPEQLPEFFGDFQCQGGHYEYDAHGVSVLVGCKYHINNGYSAHSPTTHWGYRHWLFFAMGLVLFIYNGILIVSAMDKKDTTTP